MSRVALLLLFVLPFLVVVSAAKASSNVSRSQFPKGFLFGTASSAYQYEGAVREGGRGPSIWDTYTHTHPEKIADGSNGDIAIDSYHRYQEDVKIMKDIGFNAYRFSISWTRILPNGKLSGGVNMEGIKYYNNLINKLISEGIQPFVTLFHWDSPQALEQQYGGFLSQLIVEDFCDYANICFREFGDRVKHWITFNEPWSFSINGYASGILAPGRCSAWENSGCSMGDSGREPYIVAHNQLLAHAAAVQVYRGKYKEKQKGSIGITLVSNWMIPYTNSKQDKDAAKRALEFMYGWFMDPLTKGDYPLNMRTLVGNRLPRFTKEQSKAVYGSFDFIGLNYYTARYVQNTKHSNNGNKSYSTDSRTNQSVERNGTAIGPKAGSPWLYIYPKGIEELLLYTKKTYNNPTIYITENGIDEINNVNITLQEALVDNTRIEFYRQHLFHIQRALKEGTNVRGYFAWSLFDNFEWMDGYTVRFGINYIDYRDGLKRYPKRSSKWFQNFLHK
ncbi:beta-glucosidase 24-like isoform X1 [Miscanthus floridulus]|uniref:beta-glucosidase 24-like isoform X1 n=2 Tax=Miscanthus floridulus TaxID=154761 RepID=UPI0034585858